MPSVSVERRRLLSGPRTLEPGDSLEAVLPPSEGGLPVLRYLRVAGRVWNPALDQAAAGPGNASDGFTPEVPFDGRGETEFRRRECRITDCLEGGRLVFDGRGEEFARKAFFKVGGEAWGGPFLTFEAPWSSEGFALGPDGWFGAEIEVYLPREGRSAQDIYDEPDLRFRLPVGLSVGPEGTLRGDLELPGPPAALVVVLGGRGFRGTLKFGVPRLSLGGVPRTLAWDEALGMNLATLCWPLWRLAVDGETVFEGEVFDRASNAADFLLPLPEGAGPGARLTLTRAVRAEGADAPYLLSSLEVLETPGRSWELRSRPRYPAVGGAFGVAVETRRPGIVLTVETSGDLRGPGSPVTLAEPGFHVLRFTAGRPDFAPRIVLSDGERSETVEGFAVLETGTDPVRVSTGDEVYVALEDPAYAAYFRWFLGEGAGNFYQFRPSYQWSGQRAPDRGALDRYRGLLEALGLPYAWMVEGRELAGLDLNPPREAVDGPGFRGFQAHENDGGFYYWQHFRHEGLYSDLAARHRPLGGIFAKHRPLYSGHGNFVHYDPRGLADRAEGARRFVANLAAARGPSTRHTGPSVLFRYFFQAGYEWAGAELMYGPDPVVLSALRGASRAYGKADYGSLHAVQWGSHPFTDPAHARRHYLSLATALMHGASHLNTEEGLWTDEYGNDRATEAGRAHLEAQKSILEYAETHGRPGAFVADIAVLQGRDDAWKLFGRTSVWSQEGPEWAFGAPEASFDLMGRIFYPDCVLDACGPGGWFSGTPYGPADLLPVEAPSEVLGRYRVLVFLGWNTYEAGDFDRLARYVEEGGTLVLSSAHLNTEVRPGRPPALPRGEPALERLLGPGYETAAGRVDRGLGRGRVVWFSDPRFPAGAPWEGEYEALVRDLAAGACGDQESRGWVYGTGRTAFSAWDRGGLRTLQLLNTGWGAPEPSRAELGLGGRRFPLEVRPGFLDTVFCAGNRALRPRSGTTDVLAVREGDGGPVFRVQTVGPEVLEVYEGDSGRVSVIEVPGPGIHELRTGPAGYTEIRRTP